MKALITSTGQYGPFTSITQGADRWVCDGAEYQFGVIGDATIGEYVAPPPPPKTREELKAERAATILALKVTTQAGNTFDADETSIQRLNTGVNVTGITGQTVPWVLADNTVIVATQAELAEALCLAAAAVAAVWII
jgi:hypothetical protein